MYRRGEFVTIGAVADKGADKAFTMGWLENGFRLAQRSVQIPQQIHVLTLTNTNCTAPQKHEAVASSSVDHPSLAKPATGNHDLVLSLGIVDDIVI